MSCVTWLPKSMMRTLSVIRLMASRCGEAGGASWHATWILLLRFCRSQFRNPEAGSLRSLSLGTPAFRPAYSGDHGNLGVTPLATVEMSLKPLQITLARSAEPDPQAERFRESASGRMRRWMLGAAYACHPKRARDLPHLLALTAADMARGGTRVPDRDRT